MPYQLVRLALLSNSWLQYSPDIKQAYLPLFLMDFDHSFFSLFTLTLYIEETLSKHSLFIIFKMMFTWLHVQGICPVTKDLGGS